MFEINLKGKDAQAAMANVAKAYSVDYDAHKYKSPEEEEKADEEEAKRAAAEEAKAEPHGWMDMFDTLGEVELAIGELEEAQAAGERQRQYQGDGCCTGLFKCLEFVARLLTLKFLYDCYDPELDEVKGCLRKDSQPKSDIFNGGTYSNDVLKSFTGFFIGILISFLWYVVMIYQLLYSPMISLYVCVPVAVFLSMGLAFSTNIRCITMLVFPNLCSKQGRAAIMAFIFVLVIAHPMMNFTVNVHNLSASATCGQEVGYNASKDVIDLATKPVDAMAATMQDMIDEMVSVGDNIRDAFMKIRNLFAEICNSIKRTFQWLGNMINVCNDRMGAPYRKCMSSFDKAYSNCRSKMGPMKFLCNIVSGFQWLCNVSRIGEFLCRITEKITQYIQKNITDKLSIALQDVTDMFYFKVHMKYNFNYTMEQSRTFQDIRRDIEDEVNERLGFLDRVYVFANIIFILLLIFLVIKALVYRYRYRSKDKYDNDYISFEIRRIDYLKKQKGREPLLPLKWKEKFNYVYTESPLLTKKEVRSLFLGMVMLAVTGVHVVFYLGLDYGLYWLLNLLKQQLTIEPIGYDTPNQVKMKVEGDGMFSDIFRVLISRFHPAGAAQKKEETSVTHCMPEVSPPDLHIYKVIGYLFASCLGLTLFEAYLLRLRHVICSAYFPAREKERAAWLVHHILSKRGGFKRHIAILKQKVFDPYRMPQEEPDWRSHVSARYPLIGKIFKLFGYKRKYCIICVYPGKVHDMDNFVHCDNSSCKAVYCQDCFTDANNLCNLCMKPIIYEDIGDRSEEIDSSDDSPDDAEDRKKFYAKRFQKFMVDYAIGRNRKKTFDMPSSESSSDEEEYTQTHIMMPGYIHPAYFSTSSSSSSSDGDTSD